MKKLARFAALFAALLTGVFTVTAQTPTTAPRPAGVAVSNNLQLVIEGKVVSVHDGDTVTVLDQDNKKHTIRLQGIDAPELKQDFGRVSQKNLSEMVFGKQVTILWTKVDKYRRTVGTIMLDGRDINIEQVKAGVAWHFKKYEDEQSAADRVTYAAAEESARAARLGLWQAVTPTAPGDWRQEAKTKRWGPPPPEGTIIGTSNSKKYHRPDCPGYRDMAERNRVFFKTVAEAEAAGYKRAGNCPAQMVAQQPTVPAAASPSASVSSIPEAEKAASTAAPESRPAMIAAPRVTTSSTSQDQTRQIDTSLKTIGNKNSKVFHLPGCPGYSRVSEKNRVFFDSAVEAEQAGYRRAGNCSVEPRPASAAAPLASSADASQPTTTPVPDSQPASTPAAIIKSQPSTPAGTSIKIVGNKNSKIFHLPGCPGYDRVSEKNRVFFDSSADAEAAGYRVAKNCSEANPD